MKKELDEALCRDFPLTFRHRNGDKRTTLMCFGFDCGDGWEPIIRRCSEKIETDILRQPEADREEYSAFQIKQKFGGLRYYMSGGQTDVMTEAIRQAEDEAWKTCEYCGQPGFRRTVFGWIETSCNDCSDR